MPRRVADFDLAGFWDTTIPPESDDYLGPTVTAESVAAVERALGFKIPASYVELIQSRNGGVPVRTCHRTEEGTSWAEDHIAIEGIFSIGNEASHSLLGDRGSQFWIDEWEYPAIGIYFADCPSGGHDMLCLDYRECGPQGEPQVVHVDQENDYRIVPVAKSFEAFIRGLESYEVFDEDFDEDA